MCLAEGIMALHDPELRSLYDLKVPITRQVLGWPLTVTGVRAM
jgi:uridine kinase